MKTWIVPPARGLKKLTGVICKNKKMATTRTTDNEQHKAVSYRYTSHTLIRFTHNKKDYCLQYGSEYTDLPLESPIIQNLIYQKRLIKI